MFLRKLTDAEISQIKKSKEAANRNIKDQRKKKQAEIKFNKTASYHKLEMLNKQLDALSVITGLPVIVKVEDRSLRMNYEILKKFERSLDKSNLHCTGIKIKDKSLIIRYEKHGQKGTMEIAELPPHQVDLLNGLPTIDLKE